MTVETTSYLGIHLIRKNLHKEKYSGVINICPFIIYKLNLFHAAHASSFFFFLRYVYFMQWSPQI